MHIILQSEEQTLLAVSAEERDALVRVLDAASREGPGRDPAQPAGSGVRPELLRGLLGSLKAQPHPARRGHEQVHVQADQGSVMLRAITVFGDPVELNETEARALDKRLQQAIAEAESS